MDTALEGATTSRLRWAAVRFDGRIAWIWALSAGLILYLGLDGGGYDLVVRSHAGVVIWWVVLIGALTAVLPAARISRAGWAALALLGALAAWSAIATTWSLSSERGLEEVSRLVSYFGVLLLALTTFGDRDRALRHVLAAAASAIVVLAALALLSRLRPGTFAGAQATATFLPGAHARLGWPLNYWNALAALTAIGVPLVLGLATSARTLVAQALAAAAIPLLALTAYLTFSRGGAIAIAAALIVFVALAPERIPKLATLLISAAGSAALIAGAVHRHAIEQGLTNSAARHQGSSLATAVILVCAGVAVAQVAVGLLARHGTPPRLLRVTPARARVMLAVAVVAAIAVALAVHGPSRLSHAWHDFKQPTAAALHQDAIGRFGALSGNGRYTYWKVSLDAMSGHALGGFGTGSFQYVWLPRAPTLSYIRNAHSLYVETLVEVGIIGLLLLGGFLLVLVGTAIRRVIRSEPLMRTHATAVAAACVAFVVSAAFDWIWQVSVIPITVLLLGAAVLAPAAGAKPRESGTANPAARRLLARIALVVAAVVSLVAIAVPMADTNALRRSQAAAAAGQTSTALADAQSAAGLEPNAASPRLQEALVYELQGNLPSAIQAAVRASANEPDNWQTWIVLSRLQAEAGHALSAVDSYRRARALNPRSLLFHEHVSSVSG